MLWRKLARTFCEYWTASWAYKHTSPIRHTRVSSTSGDCDMFDGYFVVTSPPTSSPHLCSHGSTTATLYYCRTAVRHHRRCNESSTPLLDWSTVCVHETMYQLPPSNYIGFPLSIEYSINWSISAASYISSLIQPVFTLSTWPTVLRLASNPDLFLPRSRLKFGERPFSIAAPKAWIDWAGFYVCANTI